MWCHALPYYDHIIPCNLNKTTTTPGVSCLVTPMIPEHSFNCPVASKGTSPKVNVNQVCTIQRWGNNVNNIHGIQYVFVAVNVSATTVAFHHCTILPTQHHTILLSYQHPFIPLYHCAIILLYHLHIQLFMTYKFQQIILYSFLNL